MGVGGKNPLDIGETVGNRNAGPADNRSGAVDRLDLSGLWTIFRRRLRVFFYTAIIVIDVAVLFAVYLPRKYTATAVVVLNSSDTPVTPTSTKQPSDVPQSNSDVETEMAIITSRNIASKVVDYLHLDDDADLRATLQSGGIKRLLGLNSNGPAEPLTDAGRAKLRATIVGWIASNIDVERVSSAYAISVSFSDTNPIRATAIANAATHIYTDEQIRMKEAQNAQAAKLLGERIVALKEQAQADFDAVQQYRIANNLLSTTGATLTEQEISAYNQQVAGARADAAADVARLNTARAQLKNGSMGDDVGEALSSPVIQSLRIQRAQLSAKVSENIGALGPRNPELLESLRSLSDLDLQIQSEISRIMSNLDAKARVSQQRLGSLSGSLDNAQGSLAQNNHAMVALDDLNRKAEVSQALYETYLNRYKEAVAANGAERAGSRMVSDARIPAQPSSPNVPLLLALGVLLGVGAGFAAAVIVELTFTGLTSGEDIRRQFGLPFFGGVPEFKTVEPRGANPLETMRAMPRSPFAESVRGVLTRIKQTSGSQQVVLLTSALPDEGKTTFTACLAQCAARAGERVLVIDCDSARRQFSATYLKGKDKTPGLREVLSGEATIAAAISLDEATGFHTLPITTAFEASEPQVDATKMAALVAQLREHFHLILLDTAPLLPVAETRELAALADKVVVIARWRHTSSNALRSAIELLPPSVQGGVGVVLSRIDMKKQGRFSREGAGAFYNSYKGYYYA